MYLTPKAKTLLAQITQIGEQWAHAAAAGEQTSIFTTVTIDSSPVSSDLVAYHSIVNELKNQCVDDENINTAFDSGVKTVAEQYGERWDTDFTAEVLNWTKPNFAFSVFTLEKQAGVLEHNLKTCGGPCSCPLDLTKIPSWMDKLIKNLLK